MSCGQPLDDEVHVHYLVPVVVVVDMATKTVGQVVVVDEDVRLDGAAVDDPSAAIDIAESVTWPRWRFGW